MWLVFVLPWALHDLAVFNCLHVLAGDHSYWLMCTLALHHNISAVSDDCVCVLKLSGSDRDDADVVLQGDRGQRTDAGAGA